MTDITDAELVLAARNGDGKAFEELTRRHYSEILIRSRSMLRKQDADDLTQDAFLTAFTRLNDLGPPYRFKQWIGVIHRNKVRNFLKRVHRTTSLIQEHMVSEMNTPERGEFENRLETVLDALSVLAPKNRETARLAYLNRYSTRDISHRLGIPQGTVKRRLWDARNAIRKEILTMNRDGRLIVPATRAPVIEIEELPGKSVSVPIRGYGSMFGSILEVGDVEVTQDFDYPEGIPTQTVTTRVVRVVKMFGRECFEVLSEFSDCEPPQSNHLDYFEIRNDGCYWILRVTADDQYPRIHPEVSLEPPAPLSYSTDESSYVAGCVKLKIGARPWMECLRVDDGRDTHTPCLRFYTLTGRQVLHQRYLGPGAPPSRHYNYESLSTAPKILRSGQEFRLWYQSVLMNH